MFDVFNVTRASQRSNFPLADAPCAICEPGRTCQEELPVSF